MFLSADNAAVGVTDEVEDYVAFGCLRHVLFDIFHGVGDVHSVVVEESVDFFDFRYFFGGESTAAKSYSVDACIAYGFACCFDEGWNVFVDKSAALKHDVLSDMAELMHERSAANDGEIVYHDFAGELGCVADDDVVADDAVVSYMAVCHDQAVVADNGFAFGVSASVDCDAFAESCVVADDSQSVLAMELEVLGNCADYGTGENGAVPADSCAIEDCDVAAYAGAFTDLDVAVDCSEWADDNILADLCLRVDISQGLIHYS